MKTRTFFWFLGFFGCRSFLGFFLGSEAWDTFYRMIQTANIPFERIDRKFVELLDLNQLEILEGPFFTGCRIHKIEKTKGQSLNKGAALCPQRVARPSHGKPNAQKATAGAIPRRTPTAVGRKYTVNHVPPRGDGFVSEFARITGFIIRTAKHRAYFTSCKTCKPRRNTASSGRKYSN